MARTWCKVTRRCWWCKQDLQHSAFSKDKTKSGFRNLCRDCQKDRNLYRFYKIHLKDWNALLEKQNFRCAICRLPMNQINVDHDHSTQTVRGLLCSNCNLGLGNFQDDINFLNNAIQYLTERGYVPSARPCSQHS
jgi:hypothetical protein